MLLGSADLLRLGWELQGSEGSCARLRRLSHKGGVSSPPWDQGHLRDSVNKRLGLEFLTFCVAWTMTSIFASGR